MVVCETKMRRVGEKEVSLIDLLVIALEKGRGLVSLIPSQELEQHHGSLAGETRAERLREGTYEERV